MEKNKKEQSIYSLNEVIIKKEKQKECSMLPPRTSIKYSRDSFIKELRKNLAGNPQNIQQNLQLQEELNKIKLSINNNISMLNNNNNANNNNIINQDQNQKSEINSMKECFKNDNISIYYNITKREGNNIDGSVYATNNTKLKITGVKISFLVQKFVKLTVLNTSGDTLEPEQSLGIKKDFTLTSSDTNKKIILKIKLHYTVNDKEQMHEFTIKNI